MRFTHPYLLIFLLIIPFGWYIAKGAKLYFRAMQFYTFNVLRSLVWLLLVLALAGLEIAWGRFGDLGLLWVMDTSESISPRQAEWFKDYLLRTTDALPSGAKAGVVTCGREANTLSEVAEPAQIKEIFEKPLKDLPDANFTNLASGVDAALSLASLGYTRRMVLLTDGNENLGELIKAAKVSGSRGVPIYPIVPPSKEMKEIVVESMDLPDEVQRGEAFEIKIRLNNLNLTKSKAVLKLLSEGKEIDSEQLQLLPGLNVHTWVQSIKKSGPFFYEVKLIASDDTNKKNNETLGAITVKGNPRLLCIEGKGDESHFLKKVLKNNEIEVVVKKTKAMPKELTELASYDGLVFNNVPKKSISDNQMKMIKRYVSDLGGGFLMLGGQESFSSGGYYKTPVEEVLPVNMDQNVSYKFKQVLLVILMDRSPSMEGRKLRLAQKAAIRVLEQLRDSDMMGLIIFDSTYENVFNFQIVWGKRQQMIESINNIKIGKGGTNIYPALEDAYNLLLNPPMHMRQLPLQIKHILLLTDGKTYRGEFEKLARKIAKKGMSISTFAVGSEAEMDLLGNIARIGRGLFHQPTDIEKLPEMFVADLENAISKTPFVEKAFTPEAVATSEILKGISIKELPPLKGYMVTKPKAGSQIVLASKVRGFNDPVLAHWRYGLGTSVAYTSDVIPRWSSKWIGWQGFAKFWVQVVRFMMRQEKSNWKVEIQRIPEGAMLTVDTGKDEAPSRELAAYLAKTGEKEIEVPLKRIGWGKYRGRIQTRSYGKFVVNLREKQDDKWRHALTRGIIIPPFIGEYQQFTPNEQLLRRVAKLSGGEYNPESNQTILAPTEKTSKFNPIWQYLVALALLIFVAEVGLRKWWL